MASDNRDWYRDWWRKKTGYVERAGFRMSEADRQRAKHRRAWRSVMSKVLIALLAMAAIVAAKRML